MFEDPFAFLPKMPPANDTGNERTPVQEIFLHLPKGDGEHVFRIHLLPDGSADLSAIPDYLRESWSTVGERILPTIGLETSTTVKPKQGAQFLEALLKRPIGRSGMWFSASPDTNDTHL